MEARFLCDFIGDACLRALLLQSCLAHLLFPCEVANLAEEVGGEQRVSREGSEAG